MPAGVGGFLSNLLNPGLEAQTARLLANQVNPNPLQGPQGASGVPSPTPDASGTGAPGTASSAAPGAAVAPSTPPAQIYGPDPINMTATEALMKLHQQDLAASTFNRGLAMMTAGVGTAEQQRSKWAALDQIAGPQDDRLKALQEGFTIQSEAQKLAERQRFAAGASLALQNIGMSKQEADLAAADPDLARKVLQDHFTTTEQQKNVDSYGFDFAESQGWGRDPSKWTAEQAQKVAQQKATAMQNVAMGNVDAATKEYNNAWNRLRTANPGMNDGQILAQHPEMKDPITYTKTMETATEQKVAAQSSYHTILPTLQTADENIKWLNKHKDAVYAAVKYPGFFTRDATGNITNWTGASQPLAWLTGAPPVTQDVLDARSKLDWLQNELYADRFAGTKNIRSNIEATRIGKAATNIDNSGNSAQLINGELKRLRELSRTSIANLNGAAGHSIEAQDKDRVDSIYTNPNSPFYNGATIEEDKGGGDEDAGKPLPAATVDWIGKKLASSPGEKDAIIKHFEDLGYDMSKYK